MAWDVSFDPDFAEEIEAYAPAIRIELLSHVNLLTQFGPYLGRPYVDTLNGSRHVNMKELRFNVAGGVWRAAFAFDPDRRAILLTAGNKVGQKERHFYKRLITTADKRLDKHLMRLEQGDK